MFSFEIINNWFKDNEGYFILLGLLISSISVIYSFFIEKKVSRMQTEYAFQKRIPSHLKKLSDFASEIASLLGEFSEKKFDLKSKISLVQTELENMKLKLNTDETKKINLLIKNINKKKSKEFTNENRTYNLMIIKFSKETTSEDDIRSIYTDLNEIIHDVNNYILDKKSKLS